MKLSGICGSLLILSGCLAPHGADTARSNSKAASQTARGNGVGTPVPALAEAGPVIAKGATFTVWERTYICVSARIDPEIWGGYQAAQSDEDFANGFASDLERRFTAINLRTDVPGDSVGSRFSGAGTRSPRCGPLPENIFVHIEVAKNSRGNPFRITYRATQDGRTVQRSVERDHAPIDRSGRDQGDTFDTVNGKVYKEEALLARQLVDEMTGVPIR